MATEDKIYLRPLGFIEALHAQDFIDNGMALPLAGGARAFSAMEVIRRSGDGEVVRRIVRAGDAVSLEKLVGKAALQRITAARKPVLDLDLSTPCLMGILNVTPDSFSDGGKFSSDAQAIDAGLALRDAGAHIIDVGGESTRPGADDVPLEDELARIVPVVRGLSKAGVASLSIDTRKAAVMIAAHEAGAKLINDVSALTYDAESLAVAKASGLPVVLMHAQGDPKSMQEHPIYDNVVLDVYDYLEARIEACEAQGIDRAQIIIDPGIGFGKTRDQNLELLRSLSLFHGLGCLLLLGASRKRFIGDVGGEALVTQRIGGSLSALEAGMTQGVQIHRVHDVFEAHQFLALRNSLACTS